MIQKTPDDAAGRVNAAATPAPAALPASQRVAVLHGKEDLRIENAPVEAPGPGEILLRLDAATTCGTDLKVFKRGYHAAMLTPPCRFGHEGAGTVAALGAGAVSATAPGLSLGERVVVANSAPCGACPSCARGQENLCDELQFLNGTYGQYLRIPRRFVERNTWRIPDALPAAHAALTEPLACVVHGFDETPLPAGARALVIGLGPIGLFWVALLNHHGVRVSGAGRGAERLAAAAALGATAVDLAAPEGWPALEAQPPFDLVVEATGTPEIWLRALDRVRKGGTVNLFGGPPKGTTVPLDTNRLHYSQITLKSPFHHRPDAFRRALQYLASGAIPAAPFIGATCPLEDLPAFFKSMTQQNRAVKTQIVLNA